jgi:phosphopentomutase
VLLVFHHPHIVKIKSDLLEGDYKDRRLAWFGSMKEIKSNKKNLTNHHEVAGRSYRQKNGS